MKSEISPPCSKKDVSGAYPETREFSSRPQTCFSKFNFNIKITLVPKATIYISVISLHSIK